MTMKKEKVTILIPSELKEEIANLKKELKTSMNTLYQEAIKSFIKQKKREKIKKEALEMVKEYKTNSEIQELARFQEDVVDY